MSACGAARRVGSVKVKRAAEAGRSGLHSNGGCHGSAQRSRLAFLLRPTPSPHRSHSQGAQRSQLPGGPPSPRPASTEATSCSLLWCGVMAAKIRIVMKSFVSQSNRVSDLVPNANKVGLPESRALYTVLRSPHIDKKSREQFSMHVKKQFLERKVEVHELRNKYFWLKRLRAPGAQCEIHISFKTRLDKKSLESKLLDGS